MTQFNIGSQHAGAITNVGRDAIIGHQQGVHGGTAADVADLRAAIARLGADVCAVAAPMVDDLAEDLDGGTPEQAASRLERLTRWLARSGALAAAGASLVEPLARIAHHLGPVAATALRLLPA